MGAYGPILAPLDGYAGKHVLVTGGASFIGSHLTETLAGLGAHVTVADDFSSGRRDNLAPSLDIQFLEGDLRDTALARRACAGKDIVFHLAAAHGGRGYIDTHPVECMNNMVLDHSVFSAAVLGGASKIVFASSACVYPTGLQAEEDQRNLLGEDDANFEEPGKAFADGEYGWAKLMGELQLRAFCKQYGISGVACRIFTAYGERENETHAVVALIAKAAARLDPYPIWGSGLQTRNFTYVGDTVTGMLLGGAVLDGFETINVGSSRHYTVLELVAEIFAAIGWTPGEIEKEEWRPVGVKSRAADNGKCEKLFGWSPSTQLDEGVTRTVRWYLEARGVPDRSDLERLLMER